MTNTNPTPLGLYIHIPWCPVRCIYCDFNTYLDRSETLKQQYHTALLREISQAGAILKRPQLDTIFFGGGTPTTLQPQQLIELVEAVHESFQVRPEAEITTEANPGTLTTDYLREIRQGGINRLSMGVQSFDNEELRFLSRLHDANTARQAVEMARTAGFDNISLDLIFNLPNQTLAQWQYNVHEALKLAPDHFSFYSLIVEPHTPLHKQVTRGEVPEPDDDVAADMYEWTIDALDEAGYVQYEISNWAKVREGESGRVGEGERGRVGEWEPSSIMISGRGGEWEPSSMMISGRVGEGEPSSMMISGREGAIFDDDKWERGRVGERERRRGGVILNDNKKAKGEKETKEKGLQVLASWETPVLASQHNLIYWRNQPYLGLGAGAYGTINHQRWANVKRPQRYIELIQQGSGLGMARDESTFEQIDRQTEMLEHIMLGLRLVREGVGAKTFEQRFGVPLDTHYATPIAYGIERGLLEWIEAPSQCHLRLTKGGRLLANEAIVQFFLEEEEGEASI